MPCEHKKHKIMLHIHPRLLHLTKRKKAFDRINKKFRSTFSGTFSRSGCCSSVDFSFLLYAIQPHLLLQFCHDIEHFSYFFIPHTHISFFNFFALHILECLFVFSHTKRSRLSIQFKIYAFATGVFLQALIQMSHILRHQYHDLSHIYTFRASILLKPSHNL